MGTEAMNGMSEKIRLMLVDDQKLFREGMATLIESEDDLVVVGEAGNGQEAIDLYAGLRPDVVLMDVQMPEVNGVEATRRICTQDPQGKIIILTTFDNDEYLFEGIRAGARGYLLKATNIRKLVEAVRVVYRGEVWIGTAVAHSLVDEFIRLASDSAHDDAAKLLIEPISEREQDILRLLVKGCRNREIAMQLSLTEGTVKNYVSALMRKVQARDRVQLVIRAKGLGLV